MFQTDQTKTYTFHEVSAFTGKYAFLSNFYYAPITYLQHQYANNEAAFQAQKTVFSKEQQRFYMKHLTNPVDARKLGRRVTLRPDWNQLRIRYMYEICLAKFIQHPELKQALLATGDAVLVEGNSWGDRFWGRADGFGENHLGYILMDIREKFNMDLR